MRKLQAAAGTRAAPGLLRATTIAVPGRAKTPFASARSFAPPGHGAGSSELGTLKANALLPAAAASEPTSPLQSIVLLRSQPATADGVSLEGEGHIPKGASPGNSSEPLPLRRCSSDGCGNVALLFAKTLEAAVVDAKTGEEAPAPEETALLVAAETEGEEELKCERPTNPSPAAASRQLSPQRSRAAWLMARSPTHLHRAVAGDLSRKPPALRAALCDEAASQTQLTRRGSSPVAFAPLEGRARKPLVFQALSVGGGSAGAAARGSPGATLDSATKAKSEDAQRSPAAPSPSPSSLPSSSLPSTPSTPPPRPRRRSLSAMGSEASSPREANVAESLEARRTSSPEDLLGCCSLPHKARWREGESEESRSPREASQEKRRSQHSEASTTASTAGGLLPAVGGEASLLPPRSRSASRAPPEPSPLSPPQGETPSSRLNGIRKLPSRASGGRSGSVDRQASNPYIARNDLGAGPASRRAPILSAGVGRAQGGTSPARGPNGEGRHRGFASPQNDLVFAKIIAARSQAKTAEKRPVFDAPMPRAGELAE